MSHSAARDRLAQHAARLAGAHGIEVIHAADASGIAATLDLILRRDQQTVFLLAGDGTVQAFVDRLALLPAGVVQPRLLLLGGGRTNLTAGDLGGRGDVLPKLERALERWRDGVPFGVTARQVLRIEQPKAPARHGFFLAAGLVDRAIRACHRHRNDGSGRLRQSDLGTACSLAALALPAMLGMREPPLDDLRVEVPGREMLAKPARWFIASTLQKRQGVLDPYARHGHGGVRFTAVAARGPSFWARLPWLITGRFTPAMDAERGYLSGRCDALGASGLSSYTLDGESFDVDPALPVTIRAGPRVHFLSL
ncbi:MAG: hypothetical protein IT530_15175 [Burkholderiales bacterium]|nr:hypothetical protein [Burkholderiales bacterium]